ncbi:hypothetical protein BDW74DRAFT_177621 [Aspergillus multicolor]|uniref:uncharacterized protein n=1 Tax=Aspergillus multicolor TaxID=41759 RepID=UPI003CCE0919
MPRWLSLPLGLALALNTLLHGTTATPTLNKRDSGLRCDSLAACTAWYTFGSALCSSGYEETPYEADGDPLGTYCERECTSSEATQCAADKCTFYRRECNLYPGNSICGKALSFCGTPVAMHKSGCTRSNMGQPVVYDDASGTCAVDEDPVKDEKLLRGINLDDCTAIPDDFVYSNPDSYELYWKCNKVDPGRFADIEKAGRAACEAAAQPGDQKPVFQANRG